MKRLGMCLVCVCLVGCLGLAGCALGFKSWATAPDGGWIKEAGVKTNAAFYVKADGKPSDGAEGPLKSDSGFTVSLTSEAKPPAEPEPG